MNFFGLIPREVGKVLCLGPDVEVNRERAAYVLEHIPILYDDCNRFAYAGRKPGEMERMFKFLGVPADCRDGADLAEIWECSGGEDDYKATFLVNEHARSLGFGNGERMLSYLDNLAEIFNQKLWLAPNPHDADAVFQLVEELSFGHVTVPDCVLNLVQTQSKALKHSQLAYRKPPCRIAFSEGSAYFGHEDELLGYYDNVRDVAELWRTALTQCSLEPMHSLGSFPPKSVMDAVAKETSLEALIKARFSGVAMEDLLISADKPPRNLNSVDRKMLPMLLDEFYKFHTSGYEML